LRQGDIEGAIEKFREVLSTFPDFAPAHHQLGMALRKKGDLAEATTAFEKARRLDPRLKPPRS
jgi:Flp pilus assembly protein TadD